LFLNKIPINRGAKIGWIKGEIHIFNLNEVCRTGFTCIENQQVIEAINEIGVQRFF
jgi:hypothetical protein